MKGTTTSAVEGSINYLGPMSVRPAFHAHQSARDNLVIEPHRMQIFDGRLLDPPPSLEREGFTLARHESPITDYDDAAAISNRYVPSVAQLLAQLTGAAEVVMVPSGVLRFGERSRRHRTLVNSHPARFVHVDFTERSAPGLLQSACERAGRGSEIAGGRRYAGFNVWRVLSPPPQDVPLTLCDARSIGNEDLVAGDAIFDAPGAPEFSFEAYLVRHNPAHRWIYYRDMRPDEVLVFKAFDTDATHPVRVPHVAFDDTTCPAGAEPRASLEVRGFVLY